MGDLVEMPPPKFTRTVRNFGGLTVILSRCTRCGRKRLVSLFDGSLAEWEAGHVCADPKENVLPFRAKSPLRVHDKSRLGS